MTAGRAYPVGCVVIVRDRRGIVREHVLRYGRVDPVYRVEFDPIEGAERSATVDVRESEISGTDRGFA